MNKTGKWSFPILSQLLLVATASPKLTVVLMLMTLFEETKLAQYDFFLHYNKTRMGPDNKEIN